MGARSGPRAKAKSTRTTTANGATWLSTTRDRSSMRRSLPATSTASRHMGTSRHGPSCRAPSTAATGPRRRWRAADHPAAGQRHDPVGQRQTTASGSCDARSTVAPSATASLDDLAQHGPGLGVEGGVGLVEQPQRGPAGHEDGQGHPPALAGRSRPTAVRRSRPTETQALEGGVDAVDGSPRRPARRSARSRPRSARRRGRRRARACPPGGARAARWRRRSWPSTTASPPVTGSRPAQARSTLVFPAPFGPSRTTTSPWATARSMPARAGNRPVRATAARRKTAEAMGCGPCYGGPAPGIQAGPSALRARSPAPDRD